MSAAASAGRVAAAGCRQQQVAVVRAPQRSCPRSKLRCCRQCVPDMRTCRYFVLLPAADGSVIENESHCHACGSDGRASLLLCCEACPFVFHTFCLKPPLSEVPPGAWYCPVCQAAEALVQEAGGLDRILAVRQSAPAPAAAAAGAADGSQQQQQEEKEGSNEFFVKWKDRSYLHCCWIANETMQRAAAIKFVGVANPVATRLRKFWRTQAEAVSNGVLREAEERGQLVHGIYPEWTQVGLSGVVRACAAPHSGCPDHTWRLLSWSQGSSWHS